MYHSVRQPGPSQHRADNRHGEKHRPWTPARLLRHAPHLAAWHPQCRHRCHKTLHFWWEDGDRCCHVVLRARQPSLLQLPASAVQDSSAATLHQQTHLSSDTADIHWQVDIQCFQVFAEAKLITYFLCWDLLIHSYLSPESVWVFMCLKNSDVSNMLMPSCDYWSKSVSTSIYSIMSSWSFGAVLIQLS